MRLAMTSGRSYSSGSVDTIRCPFLLEQFLHLGRIKRSEFVDESNAGIELEKAGR
jgi:hypothetical protein